MVAYIRRNAFYIKWRDSSLSSLPRVRLCRNKKRPTVVMLRAAKHLVFSVTYENEILRLLPQDDIATQSPSGEM